MKRLLPIALVMCLMVSCHTSRPVVEAPPSIEAAPTVEPQTRTYNVVQFTAEVEGIGANGQLRMATDSVIWVTVSKLFELGRAMATPDSLFLHAPMLGREEAIDYPTLHHISHTNLSFDDLQRIVEAPDAEAQIEALASKLGVMAKVHIVSRRRVDHLTFPYTKPTAL